MAANVHKESILAAYEDVRSDATETNWALFKYEGFDITHNKSGNGISDLKAELGDDDRAFAFVRVQTGDEMSKRMKFVLITFIGPDVGALKKARVSIDKGLMKSIIENFAVEIQAESPEDIDEEKLIELVKKAGGANYGTAN